MALFCGIAWAVWMLALAWCLCRAAARGDKWRQIEK